MEIETSAAPAAAVAGDELRRLLAATLSPDKASVDAAAAGLDRAAADPRFPLAILAVAAGMCPLLFLPPATSCNCSSALVPALVPCNFFSKACACSARSSILGMLLYVRNLCARSSRRQGLLSCFTVVPWKDYSFFPFENPYLCVASALRRAAVTV